MDLAQCAPSSLLFVAISKSSKAACPIWSSDGVPKIVKYCSQLFMLRFQFRVVQPVCLCMLSTAKVASYSLDVDWSGTSEALTNSQLFCFVETILVLHSCKVFLVTCGEISDKHICAILPKYSKLSRLATSHNGALGSKQKGSWAAG